jgi:hypothetical protein
MTEGKRGRPPSSNRRKQRYDITLDEETADWLRQFGNGNLSRGISLACEQLRRRRVKGE